MINKKRGKKLIMIKLIVVQIQKRQHCRDLLDKRVNDYIWSQNCVWVKIIIMIEICTTGENPTQSCIATGQDAVLKVGLE